MEIKNFLLAQKLEMVRVDYNKNLQSLKLMLLLKK